MLHICVQNGSSQPGLQPNMHCRVTSSQKVELYRQFSHGWPNKLKASPEKKNVQANFLTAFPSYDKGKLLQNDLSDSVHNLK